MWERFLTSSLTSWCNNLCGISRWFYGLLKLLDQWQSCRLIRSGRAEGILLLNCDLFTNWDIRTRTEQSKSTRRQWHHLKLIYLIHRSNGVWCVVAVFRCSCRQLKHVSLNFYQGLTACQWSCWFIRKKKNDAFIFVKDTNFHSPDMTNQLGDKISYENPS